MRNNMKKRGRAFLTLDEVRRALAEIPNMPGFIEEEQALLQEEDMIKAIIELAVIVSSQILGSHAFADLDHVLRIAHIMNLANRLEGCTEEENIWYVVAPPACDGWYLVPSSIGDVGCGKCWDQIEEAQTVEEVLKGVMMFKPPSDGEVN